MLRVSKYIFIIPFLLALLCTMPAKAVAPIPGSNRVEPLRPHIPQGIVSQHRGARVASTMPSEKILASRGLLIVVEFQDLALAKGNTISAFDSLANGDNYTYNGASGSCLQYYKAQSNGLYNPHFDVVGPVVLPDSMAYYGTDTSVEKGDDRYVVDFVLDACFGAQKLGTNFANYDQDNDGVVDLVYIIYAGRNQADGGDEATIWPHAWDIQSALYFGNTNQTEYFVKQDANGYITSQNLPVLDGKQILKYACSSELTGSEQRRTGIGTICHEFCHVLGLADLYITGDGAADPRLVPGSWALMSHGNYLNNGNTPPNLSVWEKYYLGWAEPSMLDSNEMVILPADGATYRMLNRTGAHPEEGPLTTDTMFYFENRQMTGWDTYLPGHGMLVWRVVYDEEEWYYNTPNNYTTRFQLIAANGSTPYTSDMRGGTRQDVPFPGRLEYTEYAPYEHTILKDISEKEGIISFYFENMNPTSIISPSVEINSNGLWYNLMGQVINPLSYHGLVIHNGKKILLP